MLEQDRKDPIAFLRQVADTEYSFSGLNASNYVVHDRVVGSEYHVMWDSY